MLYKISLNSLFLFFCFCFSTISIAANDKIFLDFYNMNVKDALHILAKFNKQDILISQHVSGIVSLRLNKMSHQEAFDLILTSHHLSKQRIGTVWFIAPRSELIDHQQEVLKRQAAWEEVMPLKTRIWKIHYAKAEDIVRLLQESNNSLLSKRGQIRGDNRTNIIYVKDTERQLQEAEFLIKKLDVFAQQVLIEVRLVSIDHDYERALGVHFALNMADSGKMSNNSMPYSLAVLKLANNSELDVQLAALEREGHAELISSPRLFAANQQLASIEAGEEIPYQEVSDGGGTAVAFKKAVLSLKVTPQIMPEGQVLLQLQINQDRASSRMVLGVPAISTRQIVTSILAKNGQTVVLGGIYESNYERGEQRMPFLGKIPLIGWFFKQQSRAYNKRELLVFVTPKIIPQAG